MELEKIIYLKKKLFVQTICKNQISLFYWDVTCKNLFTLKAKCRRK